MSRILLKYTGTAAAGQFVLGVPASEIELYDGADSEDEYAQQIHEERQHKPPILLTRRIIERAIRRSMVEATDADGNSVMVPESLDGVDIAARLADELVATGWYERITAKVGSKPTAPPAPEPPAVAPGG